MLETLRQGERGISEILAKQERIQPHHRAIVVDWLYDVEEEFGDLTMLPLTIQLFDRYLATTPNINLKDFQCVGAAASFLASLLLKNGGDSLFFKYVDIGDKTYTVAGLAATVNHIAYSLDYRLFEPTINNYLTSNRLQIINIFYIASFNLEFARLPPSFQVAGCLYAIAKGDYETSSVSSKDTCKVCGLIGDAFREFSFAKISMSVPTDFIEWILNFENVEGAPLTFETHPDTLFKWNSIGYSTFVRELGKGAQGVVTLERENDDSLVVMKKMRINGFRSYDLLLSELVRWQYFREGEGFVKINGFRKTETLVIQSLGVYQGNILTVFDNRIGETVRTNNIIKYLHLKNVSFQDKRYVVPLYARIRKELISPDDLTFLKNSLRPVFTAMITLSKHGFTHGDIKPDNILVTTSGENETSEVLSERPTGVLADFGFLKRFDMPRAVTAYTYWYRSPEYINTGFVNEMTDVWAMGMTIARIIFPILVPYFIYTEDDVQQVVNAVECIHVCLCQVDKNLADLFTKMCCDVEERWTAERCLSHAFFK